MNDTPQGDGNVEETPKKAKKDKKIRMNDTPQGDGNTHICKVWHICLIFRIRMNDTPQGDGNLLELVFLGLYLPFWL